MLLSPGLSAFEFRFNNWGANPAAAAGASVAAHATNANAEGTDVVLATAAQLTVDICMLELWVHTSSGTGSRQILLDIGVDPAGSTAYVYQISNIVVGNVGAITTTGAGQRFLFPICIKAGSQVSARIQCSVAAVTVRVAACFFGKPSNPENVPRGSFSETIGTITNSSGVAFTPGTTADGTWVDLGATAKEMWWWQLAYSIDNATITAEYTYIELAYGDGSNKHSILTAMHGGTTAETVGAALSQNTNPYACYRRVPAGAHIYVRGRANNAPDTGYNAVAIGIGG